MKIHLGSLGGAMFVLLLWGFAPLHAGSFQGEASAQDQGTTSGQTSGTNQNAAGAQSPGFTSVTEDIYRNIRRLLGFSVGVSQIYESNIQYSSPGGGSAMATSGSLTAYTNLGGRSTQIHASYSVGYQHYNNREGLDAFHHVGMAELSKRLSRRVTFQVSDRLYSSPTGYSSFLNQAVDPQTNPDLQQPVTDLEYGRERITRNDLRTGLGFRLTRNANLGVFGAYGITRYSKRPDGSYGSVTGGVSYGHRLAPWLDFTLRYSTVLVNTSGRYRDNKISQLRIGAFAFPLSRRWHVAASGGIEYASTTGLKGRLGASAGASLTRSSPTNTLAFGYGRGFSTIFGRSGLYQSDSVSVSFAQRLTRRIGFATSASYRRSLGVIQLGSARSYNARAGLDFVLRGDLVASIAADYRRQRARNLDAPDFERYMALVTLRYILPPLSR